MTQVPKTIQGTLLTIGDEILFGNILNTNAHHIALKLRDHGFLFNSMVTVGDEERAIVKALVRGHQEGDFLIVTGGLGPTDDDRTNGAAAEAFHRPLALHSKYAEWLDHRLRQQGRSWTAELERMATLPAGAEKIGVGMAGFFLEHGDKPCYFLPGVPHEMKELMSEFVIPGLLQRFPERLVAVKRSLLIAGFYESELNRLIKHIPTERGSLEIGYLPHGGEIQLTLLATDRTLAAARSRIAVVEQQIVAVVGEHHVIGRDDEGLTKVIGNQLRRNGWRLAVAESCTGGLVARKITAISGASEYFDRGLVTYSDASKVSMLGVPEDLIEAFGAVSEEVASAMAEGMQRLAGLQVAVAITGIAGPTGGSVEKPVGTVFVACHTPVSREVKKYSFQGDREQIQERAAQAALLQLWRALRDDQSFHRR
jgi:nicotinamide-nucleotide amidase